MADDSLEVPELILGRPAAEDVPAIVQTLKDVARLKAELVGERTLSSVAAGNSFGNDVGGRHLNLHQALEDLSAIVAITHAVILIARWLMNRSKTAASPPIDDRVKQVSNILLTHPATQQQIGDLLATDPMILHKIVTGVRRAEPSLF